MVVGYVVMPEHFHMLIGEPKVGTPSLAMQVLKQRVARKGLAQLRPKGQISLLENRMPPAFWQPRSYDFNVYSRKKIH